MNAPSFLRWALLALVYTVGAPATATTFCATTSAELQAALGTAGANGEHDEIRVRTGTYVAPAGGFHYDTVPSESFDLDISGGWTPFVGTQCGLQSEDPWQTVLDGDEANKIMRLFVDSDLGNVTVRRFAFLNGHVDPGLGAGLDIGYPGGAGGTVDIERNVFFGNQAAQSSALSVQGASLQKVTNNLFVLNDGATRAATYLTTTGLFGISFTNNTVLGNTHSNSGQPAVSLAAGRVFVANNNFWDNDGFDVDAGINGDRYFYNNNSQALLLHGGEVIEDHISVEPEYEGGLFNYTPVRGSPLVDAGREPEGAAPLWFLSEFDLNVSPRLIGAHVDIGAYENERIFVDGFDPAGPFGR